MYLNLVVVFFVLRLVYILVFVFVLRLKVYWEKGNFIVMLLRVNYLIVFNEEGFLRGNASYVGNELDVKYLGGFVNEWSNVFMGMFNWFFV